MKLFRRLLLSLFPSDLQANWVNPIGMFVGFISPKQFFSIVHRRLVENYKLNLFDIALEPFEVKIWLWDQPALDVKNADFYYWYWSVANLNWWSFYSPANLSTLVTMSTSIVLKEELHWYDHKYVTWFLDTIHFMTFIFVARIKVFPDLPKEEQYQWFIKLFFNLYKITLRKRWVKIDNTIIKELSWVVMQKIQVFFMLFYFYQRMNTLFSHPWISESEYYQWLFYDEMKPWSLHAIMNWFVNDSAARTTNSTISREDQKIIKLILPADSQMKYLYQNEDRYLVTDTLLSKVFENIDLESEMLPFLKDDKTLQSFLNSLMDHTRFKKNYFQGSKTLANKKFKLDQSYKVSKEIDTFMSTIEETWSMEWVQVPDQLKAESALMDKLLNFYVTFIWWLWIGRGDTFYARIFRKELIEDLVWILQKRVMQQDSLYYYWWLLYSYSKNIFYYKYAYDNVRAWNQSFQLPMKPSFKEVYSNMYILKLFDECFVNTVLQDINKKTITLSVMNPDIIQYFKELVNNSLWTLVSLEWDEFVESFYRPLMQHIDFWDDCMKALKKHLTQKDKENMKENLYTVDNWMWREWLDILHAYDADLWAIYWDMSVLWMLSTLRETLFGFLLNYNYLSWKEMLLARDYHTQELISIYCIDVLNVSKDYEKVFKAMILNLADKYHHLLEQWINMDDNKKYLSMARKNWIQYCKRQWPDKIWNFISWEDTVWLRWFYKTITYYNKRYLIPQQ